MVYPPPHVEIHTDIATRTPRATTLWATAEARVSDIPILTERRPWAIETPATTDPATVGGFLLTPDPAME
jgi:hypothetical protein